jgi:hypothetical protein
VKEAPVRAAYVAGQFVGIDLHRRRSVIWRTDQHGSLLKAMRISNDPHMLAEVIQAAAGTRAPARPGSLTVQRRLPSTRASGPNAMRCVLG